MSLDLEELLAELRPAAAGDPTHLAIVRVRTLRQTITTILELGARVQTLTDTVDRLTIRSTR